MDEYEDDPVEQPTPAKRRGTGVNAQWDEDQLRGQVNDVYQQELGRDADEGGMSGWLNAALGGQNVDTQIRAGLRNSQEYRDRQRPAPAAATPGAPAQPPASGGNPGGGQPAQPGQQQGYGNANLDGLMAQMIANQRMFADQQAKRASEQDAWRAQIRGGIMDRFKTASAPVDPNDPYIRRQVQTHDATAQRSLAQGREALAARGQAQHMGTGAADAAIQSSYENLGHDNANFESGLMSDELKQRRGEISNMLNLGSGILSGDEERMLRGEMGTMDASIRDKGVNNQNTQFYDRMGYEGGLQEALMNQLIQRELMGGGAN